MKRLSHIFLLIVAITAFASAQGVRRAAPMATAGGGGGVTFDAATTSSTYVGNTSFSFSHTTSGSDRYLIVAIGGTSGGSVSSVTYNSVSMSSVGSVVETGSSGTLYLYGLIAPATGANTLLITVSGPPAEWGAIASSYTGVNQTTAVGTPVSTVVNASSISVDVSSASNEIVVDAVAAAFSPTNTVGAGQTSNGNLDTGLYTISSSRETGSTTTTMSWTFGASRQAAMIAVAIKPV